MRLNNGLKITDVRSFGNSMYPLLIDQDIVSYKKIHFSKIKIDDLIGFIKNKQIVNHRVIYKSKDYLLTKGDHNLRPDSRVMPQSIIGKIAYVKRQNKIFNPENLYLLQSIHYFSEIIKVKKALEKNSIDYVFLKGLPVYMHYTKIHPRRIYADCDILIDPSNLKSIDSIFQSFGYQKQKVSLHPFLDFFLRKKAEVSYYRTINNFRVSFDVHIEVVFFFVQTNNLIPLYPYNLVMKFSRLLLSQKITVSMNKQKYPFLSAENQIVYLALHLFHDNFKGYHKYLFLEQVINSSKFNEQRVIQTIKEYRLENFLYPVLALLTKYYNPKLSKYFLKGIYPEKSKLKLINSYIKSTNIFQDESRMLAGIMRFKNIYLLSDTNPFLKPLIFFRPSILGLILFTLIKKGSFILKYSSIRFHHLLSENKISSQLTKTKLQPQATANQNPPSH